MDYKAYCTTEGCINKGNELERVVMNNHYRYIGSFQSTIKIAFCVCPACGAVKAVKE